MTKFYLFVKRVLPVLFLVTCSTMALAKGRTVSGKVTSGDDGSAVPGVNILEKGTSNGTVTDADGNYRISVGDNATLVFSFVGFTTQELAVGTQTNVNVAMATDVQALQEVVVTGYGQVEARDVTGTIVSLKKENFNAGVITSPEQLMQGRVAGVQIATTTGEPGAQNNIRIRGTSSVLGGNQPLYVVDGVPITAQLDADLVDRPPAAADLLGHPAPGPIRQHQPWRGDRRLLLGP
jgi:iron complex outermembrane receptor protein